MRTTLYWTVATGLAVVGVVPASFAQSAGTGVEEGRQTHDEMTDGPRSAARRHTGVFVDVPIGRVWVGPEFVDGEPTYVRRTEAKEGVTIVEVSATPFMPVLASSEVNAGIGTPADQPASW